jgi:hypothetical protein
MPFWKIGKECFKKYEKELVYETQVLLCLLLNISPCLGDVVLY